MRTFPLRLCKPLRALIIGIGASLDFSPGKSDRDSAVSPMAEFSVDIGLPETETPTQLQQDSVVPDSPNGSHISSHSLSGEDDNPQENNDRFIHVVSKRQLRQSTLRARAKDYANL